MLQEDNPEVYNEILIEDNKNIEKDLTEYNKIKDEFEKSHFKIMYPFMYATIIIILLLFLLLL